MALTMTAKELKNRTGDAFRAVDRGESVVLTRHGKAVATMVPSTVDAARSDIELFVSWDAQHFAGKICVPVATPQEALRRHKR